MSDYIQLPADGAGKKVHTTQRTDGNGNVLQTQVVQIGDKTTIDNLLKIDERGAMNIRFAEGPPQISSFGSLKTVQATSIAVYEHTQSDNSDLFTQEFANGGAVEYSAPTSTVIISTTSANGSSSIRTSNRYHYHTPATGQVILMTVTCSDTGKTNNIRQWGYFDDNDGVFFSLNETTFNVGVKSAVTGSVVETLIPRDSWNVDKMDGTGISGFNLDVSKFNIYFIDFQWLGAGRIRYGCYDDKGERQVMHIIKNAGHIGWPYMKTGSLPIKFVCKNTGLTSGGSSLRIGTGCVKIEGNQEEYTFYRYSYATGEKTITTNTSVLGVRSKLTFNGNYNSTNVYPESFCCNVSGGSVKLDVYWPVTVSNNSFLDDNGSTLEADLDPNGTNSVTPGPDDWLMRTFFLDVGSHEVDLGEYFETIDEGILRTPTGQQPPLYFVATRLTGEVTKMYASLNYKELR